MDVRVEVPYHKHKRTEAFRGKWVVSWYRIMKEFPPTIPCLIEGQQVVENSHHDGRACNHNSNAAFVD